MHDWEKSDSAIVAVKPPNKAGLPVAEAVEPRAGAKGNADQQSTHRTQSRVRVTQALSRVRHAASPSNTQGRSRMPELGSSGSVRGVSSNGHPYRDPRWIADLRTKSTIVAMEAAAAGLSPVDFMLAIMRNEELALAVRLDAAKAVAPYTNPRLASIDATVKSTTEVSLLTDEQRRQRARQAILDAFVERPMRLIEGEVVEAELASTQDSEDTSETT